ncbi:MAG: protein kinase, partial [Acidobacteriota bacterium]
DVATKTSDGTRAGTVVGTIGYMSPEQVRGAEVDRRTDIWAFGCIVFEMLTGRAPFAKATTSDTIAAIIGGQLDWTVLPTDTSPLVARTLRRCLETDVDGRQRDIADAAADLRDFDQVQTYAPATRRSSQWPAWAGAAVLGGVMTATALLPMRALTPHYDLSKAVLTQVTFDSGLTDMPALSPDGNLLAYASDRTGRGDLDLYVEQTSGGAPIRLTDDPADDVQASFSPDGSQIVFRSERDGGGLYVVAALGGNARLLVAGGRWPRFSPDGRKVAYWTGAWRGNALNGTGAAFVLDLAGGDPIRVAAAFFGAREPVWSPDGKSLLVVGRQSRDTPTDLYVVPLDGGVPTRTGAFDRNEFRSDLSRTISATIMGDWREDGVLMSTTSGLWLLSISPRDGTLTAEPRRLTVSAGRQIHATSDRSGSIVFSNADAPRVIERAPLNDDEPAAILYTDALTGASRPSQTADGSRIVYARRAGPFIDFWLKQKDGPDRLLIHAPSQAGNQVISPNAELIAYTVGTDEEGGDGYTLKVSGGVPSRICERCLLWGFFSDSRHILVHDEAGTRLRALDVEAGDNRIILKSATRLGRIHMSPDDRRIAFNFNQQEWIAPVYPDRPTPQSEWRKVDEQTVGPRACGWSMDSQIAYLLLDTDGFRCLWGQRVDPKTANLIGKPFAVRHFHRTVTQEFSTSFGNAISEKGFIYGGGLLKANLWRLTMPR